MSPTVFFYISGHGFGHAIRQIAIINAVHAALPEVRLIVRTSAPRWLFERTGRGPFTLVAGETDTGVVQIDSLRPDEAATIVRARAFQQELPGRAADEAGLLRQHGATLVVTDAPVLACAAAAAAGVPSIVCANFTWDWIYEDYSDEPGVAGLVASLGETYSLAEAAWRMPLHGGFRTIGAVVDVPFVARHARADMSADAVRAALGLPAGRRLALVSFGGYGLRQLPLGRVDCLDEWDVVLTSAGGGGSAEPPGVHVLDEGRMYQNGLRYEDLVKAVDVVITKPGYGIISDCVANDTAMLYTPRGRFAEYDVMVREMPGVLRCGGIALDAFERGEWAGALDRLWLTPPPPHRPRTDGAAVVTGLVRDRLSAL